MSRATAYEQFTKRILAKNAAHRHMKRVIAAYKTQGEGSSVLNDRRGERLGAFTPINPEID